MGCLEDGYDDNTHMATFDGKKMPAAEFNQRTIDEGCLFSFLILHLGLIPLLAQESCL